MGSSLDGRRFLPTRGYEDAKEHAKLKKSVHRETRISYNFSRCCFELRHPCRQKMEAAVLAANREVAVAIVDLFAEHDQVSASVRMEWICYSNFVARNPCIMQPLR
ncbi:hypothetical protein GGD62_008414, partial [Bradyrhizobium sp. ERR14]|nr:hypothetical protein [Bradyrhizobium sp. ERR14]